MKRAVIASILGLAASAATSFGQANFLFDTYYTASSSPPWPVVTWTTDASLAPAGKAGLSVLDSEGFKADLLWKVGISGDLGLSVPTSTIPLDYGAPFGGSSGWIEGGFVSFDPAYAGKNITFTIEVWQGTSWATATARGSITWTELGVTPGGYPGGFEALPQAPIYVSLELGRVLQPEDQVVQLGGTATFYCGAITNSCVWLFDGQPIPGATNNILVLTNARFTDAGYYSVVVSNMPMAGDVYVSSSAVLQVLPAGAPSIQVNNRLAVGTVSANGSAVVTISGGFTNGFIFYTLDGTTPTTSSLFYSGPITLTSSATVQAMSLSTDFSQTAFAPPVTVQITPFYSLQTSTVGSGTITVVPSGNSYLSNTVVTLTANPAPSGWVFDHWSGDVTGNINPVSLTMNGPRNVQAVFQSIPVYSLQTSVVGSGTISVNPAGNSYNSNTVVTLTANAATYWAFDHWSGDVTGNMNPVSLTMNGPRNVQAVFVPTAYPLTVSTPGGGTVSVNGQPFYSAYYLIGSVVTLTATASNGWSFLAWQGDATGASNPLNVTMNQSNNIQAVFGTVVGTNAVGGGNIVLSPPNPVPFGATVVASAVPSPGQFFVTWSGAASGTNSPTTIIVTTATPTVEALFSALPPGKVSLSAIINGNGMVTISPRQVYYNIADVVTLTAVTNGGSTFYGWSMGASGTANPLALVLNTNTIVQANFNALQSVTVSPASLIVLIGSNAVLTANALGLPPFSYQWQSSQGPISGATNVTYTIINAQTNDSGYYSVIVSNPYGSVTSAVATVTVVIPPGIIAQPASQNIAAGSLLSLAVTSIGTSPLNYQWQNSFGPITGATNASFILNPAQTNDSDNYFVIVSNPYGSVTSSVATVFVYVPVNITAQPMSQIVPAYATVSFGVAALGFPAPSYQWMLNGTNLPGAVHTTLTISNLDLGNLGTYSVFVSNPYSYAYSDTAILSMSPSIESPYTGGTAIWGEGAVLSVGAIGSGTLGYQWFVNGVTIPGATNQTYTIPTVRLTDGGLYSVVVSSPFGSETNAAQLVVNPANISIGLYGGITISGVVGYTYGIQYTTDLSNTNAWMAITNVTLQEPVELWLDTSVDASKTPKRYYRVLAVPPP